MREWHSGIGCTIVIALLLALVSTGPVLAQPHEITSYSVDGGGITDATGGGYTLDATIGQPDAGPLTDGTYTLNGGFLTLPVSGEACPSSGPPLADRLPAPGDPINQKVRYLSFSAGDPGHNQAVRVIFADLPPPYDLWNGTEMWVGEPRTYCENAGQSTPPGGGCGPAPGLPLEFQAATLQCDPYYTDWSTMDVIHVWHEGILSGSGTDRGLYEVQVIDEACSLANEDSYSDPLVVEMARWGDVVGSRIGGVWWPPDGTVNVASDVTALIDKFKNLPGAIQKARADLEPWYVDKKINITDASIALDAFRGFPYPYTPSGPPPCSPGASGQQRLDGLSVGELIAPADATITVVPSETVIQPDDIITVDVFVTGALDVRSYQVMLAVDGGREGTLLPADLRLDVDRADYIFGNQQNIDAVDHIGGRIGALLLDGGAGVDDLAYLGTFSLQASEDAAGTFEVYVTAEDGSSSLHTSTNEPIGFANPKATVMVGTRCQLRGGFEKE